MTPPFSILFWNIWWYVISFEFCINSETKCFPPSEYPSSCSKGWRQCLAVCLWIAFPLLSCMWIPLWTFSKFRIRTNLHKFSAHSATTSVIFQRLFNDIIKIYETFKEGSMLVCTSFHNVRLVLPNTECFVWTPRHWTPATHLLCSFPSDIYPSSLWRFPIPIKIGWCRTEQLYISEWQWHFPRYWGLFIPFKLKFKFQTFRAWLTYDLFWKYFWTVVFVKSLGGRLSPSRDFTFNIELYF